MALEDLERERKLYAILSSIKSSPEGLDWTDARFRLAMRTPDLEYVKKVIESNRFMTKITDEEVDDHFYHAVEQWNHTTNQDRFLEMMKLFFKHPRFNPAAYDNRGIRKAVSLKDNDALVKLFFNDPRVDPSADDNYAIRYLVSQNDLEMVEVFLTDWRIDPSANKNEAIVIAVKQCSIEMIKRILDDPRVNPSVNDDICIKTAVESRDYNIIELLLKDSHVDPTVDNNICLRTAVKTRNLAIIKLLLSDPMVDPSANGNECLIWSYLNNRTDIIELIEGRPGVSVDFNLVLTYAARFGNLKLVKTIVDQRGVDPSVFDNESLIIICKENHFDVASYLLDDPRVDPSARDNEAFVVCSTNKHYNIALRLLKDPRVNPADRQNEALFQALTNREYMFVDHLLEDSRVDPGDRNSEALSIVIDNLDPKAPFNCYEPEELARVGGKVILLDKFNTREPGAEVYQRSFECFETLLKDPRVNPEARDNEALFRALKKKNWQVVSTLLLDKRVDCSSRQNNALIEVIKAGKTRLAKIILDDSRVDPSPDLFVLLQTTKNHYRYAIMEMILDHPKVNLIGLERPIRIHEPEPLTGATSNDRVSFFRILNHPKFQSYLDSNLIHESRSWRKIIDTVIDNPYVDFSVQGSEVLWKFIEEDDADRLRIVLSKRPELDPSVNNNKAIRTAAKDGKLKIMRILLGDSRIDPSASKDPLAGISQRNEDDEDNRGRGDSYDENYELYRKKKTNYDDFEEVHGGCLGFGKQCDECSDATFDLDRLGKYVKSYSDPRSPRIFKRGDDGFHFFESDDQNSDDDQDRGEKSAYNDDIDVGCDNMGSYRKQRSCPDCNQYYDDVIDESHCYFHDIGESEFYMDQERIRNYHPVVNHNYALRWALLNCHMEIVDLLIQDPRVHSVGFHGTCAVEIMPFLKNHLKKKLGIGWVLNEIKGGWADIILPLCDRLPYHSLKLKIDNNNPHFQDQEWRNGYCPLKYLKRDLN